MADFTPMPMCPMADTCKGMMERPLSGLALMISGIALMVLGVAVLIEPRILLWLVAVALVLMGIALLILARIMRGIGERFRHSHEQTG